MGGATGAEGWGSSLLNDLTYLTAESRPDIQIPDVLLFWTTMWDEGEATGRLTHRKAAPAARESNHQPSSSIEAAEYNNELTFVDFSLRSSVDVSFKRCYLD